MRAFTLIASVGALVLFSPPSATTALAHPNAGLSDSHGGFVSGGARAARRRHHAKRAAGGAFESKHQKRGCKPRPASSSTEQATSSTDNWQAPAPTSSASPAPAPSSDAASSSSSTSSSAAPAQTPASSGNNAGKKAGLAWANGDADPLDIWSGGDISWYYTWSSWPVDGADKLGFEFVPQLWGWKSLSDWNQNKDKFKQWAVTHVLAMNEPNQDGQAQMSAQDGATLWFQQIEPLRSQGFRLVSPAPTSAPSGKQWIQDFINAGANPDVIALHYYGTDADQFISYVEDFHNTFNKPIWITEYACQNFNGGAQVGQDEVAAFMSKVNGWMKSTDYIERFAWFGAMNNMQNVNTLNTLFSDNGNGRSALGNQYLYNN